MMEPTEQKPTIEQQTSVEQASTQQQSSDEQQAHAEQQSVTAQPIPIEQHVITEQNISTEQQILTTNEHPFYNLPAPINRDIKVFSPSSDGTNSNRNLPDDFYNLSSNEIKSLYQSQLSATQKLQNPGFRTKAQREAEEQEKEKRFPKTMIRVRFPNRIQIQAQFLSREKVSTLFDFVKSALRNSDRPFTLFQPPRSKLIDMNISLYKANLSPSSVLTFAWGDNSGNNTEDPLSDMCLSLLESLPFLLDLSRPAEESSSAGPKKGLPKWLQKGILKK